MFGTGCRRARKRKGLVSNNGVSDKRQHNRFEFKKPVQVFPVVPSVSGNIFEVHSQSTEMLSHNISEGGLRLETPGRIQKESLLKMNFEMSKDQSVEVYGKVMWTQDKQFGVRFILPDPELRQGLKQIQKNGKKKPTE
jgi:hypothetical protein